MAAIRVSPTDPVIEHEGRTYTFREDGNVIVSPPPEPSNRRSVFAKYLPPEVAERYKRLISKQEEES